LHASIPGGPFDVAGAFFNTLNHLGSTGELEAALAAIADALRPGGLLMFDVNNDEGFRAWWQGSPQVYDGPGWELEISSHFDEAARTAQADLRISRSALAITTTSSSSPAPMRHETATVRETLFAEAEIRDSLLRCGFEGISAEPWAPFPDGVPGATFWTARRPAPPSDRSGRSGIRARRF
jgi:SAM-dependent methyltransferase